MTRVLLNDLKIRSDIPFEYNVVIVIYIIYTLKLQGLFQDRKEFFIEPEKVRVGSCQTCLKLKAITGNGYQYLETDCKDSPQCCVGIHYQAGGFF